MGQLPHLRGNLCSENDLFISEIQGLFGWKVGMWAKTNTVLALRLCFQKRVNAIIFLFISRLRSSLN